MTPTPTATPTPTPTPTPIDPDEYFKDKTVRIVTGSSEGTSYDAFSRFVAAAAERHFPESTTFDVENVTGAAQYNGLRAVLDSEPDGLTVGVVHSRWFQRQAIVGDVPNFDLDEITILGSPTFTPDGDAYCVDRRVATSWQDVLDLGRPLRIGSTGPGNEPAIDLMVQSGAPFEVIYGYSGTTQIVEAFDKGDLDLSDRCGSYVVDALAPWWIDQRRLVPLFYVTRPFDEAYLARLGHTGPLPPFFELPGLNLNEAQRAEMEALQASLLLSEIARVFILPAGVPGVLKEYWQERFDRTMEDRRFIHAISNAGYDGWYGYGRTDQLLDIIRGMQGLDQSVKDFLRELTGLSALDRFMSGG